MGSKSIVVLREFLCLCEASGGWLRCLVSVHLLRDGTNQQILDRRFETLFWFMEVPECGGSIKLHGRFRASPDLSAQFLGN